LTAPSLPEWLIPRTLQPLIWESLPPDILAESSKQSLDFHTPLISSLKLQTLSDVS
jgi:hypothetical protein